MENAEEEDSNPDIKEKIPVSGKKHGMLTWKSQRDQTKKKKEENEDISLERFELEAKKMCQKYNQYTQRKEQEISKVSPPTYTIQTRIVTGPLKVRRIEVMPSNPGNFELKWNEIGLDSDCEAHNPRSADTSMYCDSNNNIRRPAVTSMNCNKKPNIMLPAILSSNYDNKISRPPVMSKRSNTQQNIERAIITLEDIVDSDDNTQGPAVTSENCDSDHNISETAVTPENCDNDQNDSRPADTSVNCDSDHTIPRPAVASINLTKNFSKLERQRRRRRTKELKKKKSTRFTRSKSNKRYEEYFLDESESEGDDDVDEEEVFNFKNELALPSAKHFNRWQKQKVESEKSSESEKEEQPESDIAKWVFDVLSISKVTNNQAICEQMSTTTPQPLPSEQELEEVCIQESEEEDIAPITPEQEEAFEEFLRVDPDYLSKPFKGSAAQIPVSHVIQTLPNMVPRDGTEDDPIKHLHHISNEPMTDDEDEAENDGIMGSIRTRLIRKAIKSSNKKTEVKPFRCGEAIKKELKIDDFRDEAPIRWADNLISEYDSIIAAMRL